MNPALAGLIISGVVTAFGAILAWKTGLLSKDKIDAEGVKLEAEAESIEVTSIRGVMKELRIEMERRDHNYIRDLTLRDQRHERALERRDRDHEQVLRAERKEFDIRLAEAIRLEGESCDRKLLQLDLKWTRRLDQLGK